ncbi:MAG: hypothetical protein EOO53_14025 [Gammaproteobacteria bacterium]|nr:MAG: hypothetical protein EOO53_14025 [Gammaproteobacteria bacterium]
MLALILIYLFTMLLGSVVAITGISLEFLPAPYNSLKVPLMCVAVACIGGCVYCLRAMYLNKCVYKRWDPAWHIWYFLRPVTSIVSGGVSYLFLSAGLLILESKSNSDSSEIGFLALAFVAGYNVDKFFVKIEDIAKTIWGIENSSAPKPTISSPDTQP